MRELLLIELALCAALIVVAVLVLARRWHRDSERTGVPGGQRGGAAAFLAGERPGRGESAFVPGFGHQARESGTGLDMPARRRQAPTSHAASVGLASRQPGPAPAGQRGPAPPDQRGSGPASRPSPAPAGQRSPDPAGRPNPGPAGQRGPARPGQRGAAVGKQQGAAGATAFTDRIGSFYDDADRPMAAYLAALGWAEERRAHDLP